MLFSQRYFRAIESNIVVVDIPHAARRKLWAWLLANNASLGIRRDAQQQLDIEFICPRRDGTGITHRTRMGVPSGAAPFDQHRIACRNTRVGHEEIAGLLQPFGGRAIGIEPLPFARRKYLLRLERPGDDLPSLRTD